MQRVRERGDTPHVAASVHLARRFDALLDRRPAFDALDFDILRPRPVPLLAAPADLLLVAAFRVFLRPAFVLLVRPAELLLVERADPLPAAELLVAAARLAAPAPPFAARSAARS